MTDPLAMKRQIEIAARAEVAPQTINLWLSGVTANPKADTLDKVCRELGLKLAFADGRFVARRPIISSPSNEAAKSYAASPPLVASRRPRMALWRWQ